ncbi:hypothetical protein [Fulvivirga sp.]|uniref:hypothetical protein n=1 Tax=Fulvivirga sp. TaxID=1931237 RepID=UPI0032ECA2FE
METLKLKLRTINQLVLAVLMTAVLVACGEEDMTENQSEAAEIVSAEAEMDAVFEDVDDISSVSLESADANSGDRIAEGDIEDDRICEGVFSYEGTREEGTITLDFGDGCIDANGNVRKGKIFISHVGSFFLPGSTTTLTFEDYSINDIQVEGKRTVTNITEDDRDTLSFSVMLEGGKVTWPDGTFATREVDHVRVWERALNPINDRILVSGTASGTTRRGVTYASAIAEDLVFVKNCRRSRRAGLPVDGVNVITTSNKVITLDFGDGECDNEVTITVDGVEEDVTLG